MSETDPAAARREHLARSWDEAAAGYDRYFVPRFAPWTDEAIRALAKEARRLPAGAPILVPCCGPGQELIFLALSFPDREIRGIDLSPGMVKLARARVGGSTGVWVEEGDASILSDRFAGLASGLLSCFGLQQLPDPEKAFDDWARCLAPGGMLSVVLWPPDSRDGSVFDVLQRLVRERAKYGEPTWEPKLRGALERARLEVLVDRDVRHEMEHESAASFFDALASNGPLRSLAREKGPEFTAELKRAFLEKAPRGPVKHSPRAKHFVALRPK